MGRIGYAGANMGEREILSGFDRFQQTQKTAAFPFISANMVYQDSGEPVLAPSLVKTVELAPPGGKKQKLRLGILGLARMNAGLSQQTPAGRRIVTSDPVAAARQAVPALRKKADLLVVLATLEPEQAKNLVKEVPGIDIVLAAFGAVQTVSGETSPESRVVQTKIVYAGNQGKKVGEIRVFLGREGKPTRMETNLVSLGRIVPDDPALMDLVEKNRFAINEIHRKEAPLVDSSKMTAMGNQVYVKVENCKSCHEEAYQVWEGSKHATAFKILEDKHQDYNPDCVGCHTTGFRRPTGFVNARSSADLMNVQCEACHGPGKDHPEKVGKGYGAAGLDTCQGCHTADNSPDFDPTAYMVKIRHWKSEGGAAAAGASNH
jgi:cytochrome c554/c'-like protein